MHVTVEYRTPEHYKHGMYVIVVCKESDKIDAASLAADIEELMKRRANERPARSY